ncbi:putative holin-like toxin [Ruminococcus difficilis]|nr:putative holin-like toxin [Ruminococcus difficilis]
MQYVTYSDLIAFAMFIVAIITLVFTILMFTHKK